MFSHIICFTSLLAVAAATVSRYNINWYPIVAVDYTCPCEIPLVPHSHFLLRQRPLVLCGHNLDLTIEHTPISDHGSVLQRFLLGASQQLVSVFVAVTSMAGLDFTPGHTAIQDYAIRTLLEQGLQQEDILVTVRAYNGATKNQFHDLIAPIATIPSETLLLARIRAIGA